MNIKKNLFVILISAASFFCTYMILNFSLEYRLQALILFFIINAISFIFFLNFVIKKRIEFLYKNISLLDNDIFNLKNKSTDLKTLIQNLEKFTENKKQEMILLGDRDKFRREFIGNLAHELKTPIFIIQGYIFSVVNELETENFDKNLVQDFLKRTEKSLDNITNIIDSMNTIGNIETGIYNINLVNINVLDSINDCISELEILARKKNIKIIFDRFYTSKLIVLADKDKIKQLIYNILSNAIYYGEKEIIIGIRSFEDKYKISIKDDGIGMSVIDRKRIFERFYRADKSRDRNTGGSGLGMSIVKHIIEIHNEKIEIKSDLNQGTEVIFSLKKVH